MLKNGVSIRNGSLTYYGGPHKVFRNFLVFRGSRSMCEYTRKIEEFMQILKKGQQNVGNRHLNMTCVYVKVLQLITEVFIKFFD